MQEMRDSIEISLNNIPNEMIQACYCEFMCLQLEGRHIEHSVMLLGVINVHVF